MTVDRFGERIGELRDRLRLSQGEVARRTGIRENSIGRIERGDMGPSVKTVMAFFEAFGVSPHYLLTGEEVGDDVASVPPPGLVEYLASPEAADLTEDERAGLAVIGRGIQRMGRTPTPYSYAAVVGTLRMLPRATTTR